ncbi:conserved hypothetical protein [Ixodes scapularis]|uniref:Thioredoxin domain-containing protein n=1 Tax=Ixodes scapularis TaxID=6945 RepID=B7PPT4_IXOSC|nr:conserved hypothetical protein [Ixodes scapularis]|eukprot:XP_002435776.1 conserved hypothetical protein [Ixodes scapularis]
MLLLHFGAIVDLLAPIHRTTFTSGKVCAASAKIASQYLEQAPFLCERMKIRVLPTIVLFKDFVSKDMIVGFDSLGGTDDFSTEMMEWRIARAGILNYAGDLTVPPNEAKPERKPAFAFQRKTIRGKPGDDDSDDD